MCVMDFSGQWDFYLPLIEFAYDNNYHASIWMASYELLYSRKCWALMYWEVGERHNKSKISACNLWEDPYHPTEIEDNFQLIEDLCRS